MGYLSICMQPFVDRSTSEDAFSAFQFGGNTQRWAADAQHTAVEGAYSPIDRAFAASGSHRTLLHGDHANEASVMARLGLTEKLLRLVGGGRRDTRITDNLEPLRPMSHAALVSL